MAKPNKNWAPHFNAHSLNRWQYMTMTLISQLLTLCITLTSMINHVFISFSAVQNIWCFLYSPVFFTIYGYITNSQRDQLPVGLIAQLAKHCTGIAEVLSSNPVQAWICSDVVSHLLKLCITAMVNHVLISFQALQIYDISYIHLYRRSLSREYFKPQ